MIYCWYEIIVLDETQKGQTECQVRWLATKRINYIVW